MRASFIHIADTHLGYEQYGVRERFNDLAAPSGTSSMMPLRARSISWLSPVTCSISVLSML